MGTGINKIKSLLKEAQTPAPEFEFGNFYTIIFPRITETSLKRKGKLGETSGKRRENVGETSGKIISLMKQNPFITIPQISSIVGITERSVERNIKKLQKDGLLKRIGPAKGGRWEVVDGE